MGVGEHARVNLRAPVQQQRRDHTEDHAEHDPCGPGVRAEKPRPAALPVRVVPQPDHAERDDPGQYRHGEQVLDEPGERPVPDPRNGERPGEQGAERFDDRQQQDGEAPERQGMRRARHRPLQQLALPDHLGGLRRHVPAGMRAHRRDPLGGGLPAARQPLQPPQPAPGDRERRGREEKPDDDPYKHRQPLTSAHGRAQTTPYVGSGRAWRGHPRGIYPAGLRPPCPGHGRRTTPPSCRLRAGVPHDPLPVSRSTS